MRERESARCFFVPLSNQSSFRKNIPSLSLRARQRERERKKERETRRDGRKKKSIHARAHPRCVSNSAFKSSGDAFAMVIIGVVVVVVCLAPFFVLFLYF